MFVIAGLGNPGSRYANNRHNFGFMVAHAFARLAGADGWRSKFQAETSRCRVGDVDVLLVCPMNYMNRSGESIQAAMSFYRVPVTDLLVVHDELDHPFGTMKLKQGGGHAGHNGLRSIIQHLGEPEFSRLRCGIGRPPEGHFGDTADYVLSDFTVLERDALPEVVDKASKALMMVLRKGFGEASKVINMRPKPPKPPKPPKSPKPSESSGESYESSESSDSMKSQSTPGSSESSELSEWGDLLMSTDWSARTAVVGSGVDILRVGCEGGQARNVGRGIGGVE